MSRCEARGSCSSGGASAGLAKPRSETPHEDHTEIRCRYGRSSSADGRQRLRAGREDGRGAVAWRGNPCSLCPARSARRKWASIPPTASCRSRCASSTFPTASTAGHIHVGPRGVAGPIILDFPNIPGRIGDFTLTFRLSQTALRPSAANGIHHDGGRDPGHRRRQRLREHPLHDQPRRRDPGAAGCRSVAETAGSDRGSGPEGPEP